MKHDSEIKLVEDIKIVADPEGLAALAGLVGEERALEASFELLTKARSLRGPRLVYRDCMVGERGEDFVTLCDGVINSRVMAVNLEQTGHAFPFVATCGKEIEEWTASFETGLEKFLAETIRTLALASALRTLDDRIREKFDSEEVGMMNPGSLPDWPLTEQGVLFDLLGKEVSQAGITLNDDMFMYPSYSASGIKYPAQEAFQSCLLCSQEDCPNRRMEYDPELYDRKYSKE